VARQASTKLPSQARNALVALIVGGIAAIVDSTMVTLAVHRLVSKLHSTDGTLQRVTTAYLLATASAIPTTGWAERQWGGKQVWIGALVLFVLASILCAVSWNDASLIGFRFLQGVGAGLIFPLMQTLAVRAEGGHISSRLMATVSLPIALGTVLGPVIGGVNLNALSWRSLFLVNVPVIAVGLLLAWRWLPSDRPPPAATLPRLDLVELALLGPALAGTLLGLSQLSEKGRMVRDGVLVPLSAVGTAIVAVALQSLLAHGTTNGAFQGARFGGRPASRSQRSSPHQRSRMVVDIEADGGQATACAADVTQPDDLQRVVAHAVQHYGRLDALVANAGVAAVAPLPTARLPTGTRWST
jgi:MFS family permease